MPTVTRHDFEQLAVRLEADAELLEVQAADMRLAAAMLRAAVARGFPPTPIDVGGSLPETARASHSSS